MSTPEWSPQPAYREAAERAVAEAKHVLKQLRHYQQVVRQMPLLLRRHGLGQTLTYLSLRGAGRPNSPFELLALQLERCLSETLALETKPLLAALTQNDSALYLTVTEHTRLFLTELIYCLEDAS